MVDPILFFTKEKSVKRTPLERDRMYRETEIIIFDFSLL